MITSIKNEKIKNVIKLLSSAKARRTQQAFVAEGERIVREIPTDRILECYVSEEFISKTDVEFDVGDDEKCLQRVLGTVSYEVVADDVFRKMCDTQNPQGILCVVSMSSTEFDDFLKMRLEGPLRILTLEGIQDPGNMGTMIRTAEGAGFDMILADRNTVDIYNPKVTRSTMGSMFRIPVIYTDDLEGALCELKAKGVTLYAAHLNGTNEYDKEKYSERLAILIGNEGNGLSDSITACADRLVRIPMQGKLESLNAAVAAALLMYEAR